MKCSCITFLNLIQYKPVPMFIYITRARDQHRQTSHRLQLTSKLPQNMGPKLFNRLPANIKLETRSKKFKELVKEYLLGRACYSIEEYLK